MVSTSLITNHESLTANAIKWVKANRVEAFFLALILLTGALFRLYRIDEYMTFLGDEGRDVIIVRRLLVNLDPILIGPRTSIGDMYLGPLYYYLMAPFLLLANFSPVGPAVMIALLGVATIFFVWYAAREWFASYGQPGRLAAFVAATLYTVSQVVITYSRSSWNPNIMPFFALLCIYSIWRVWQRYEWKWLIILGISYAFVLQSHYLGLLLAPTLGLFWILSLLKVKGKAHMVKGFVKNSVIGGIIFLLLMSPLVIFDLRHGWRNFASMEKFFLERQTTVSARPWSALPKIPEISKEVITRLVAGTNEKAGIIVTVFFAVGILWTVTLIYINKTKRGVQESSKAFLLLLVWLSVALIGLGVYKQEIYDHYYGFFFAAPFFLLGGLAESIVQSTKGKSFLAKLFTYPLLLIAFLLLIIFNLSDNPLKYGPNRQLQRTIEVAEKIADESNAERFNIAVIAERNYEGAYQYFLEKWNVPVVIIDAQRADETITEQLFVVCELPVDKCDPTHNPKTEIANFGWSIIEGEWEVGGTILYKLTHSL